MGNNKFLPYIYIIWDLNFIKFMYFFFEVLTVGKAPTASILEN
jgi:hypothetical protein